MIAVMNIALFSRVAFFAAATCSGVSNAGRKKTVLSASPTCVPGLLCARIAWTARPWPRMP